MVALGTSLCLEQTIPNTGAAGLLHPGTGQSCLARLRTGVDPRKANLGGRPRRLGRVPPPTAAMSICRARLVASASTAETNRPTKSSTSERILDSGEAVLGICNPTENRFFRSRSKVEFLPNAIGTHFTFAGLHGTLHVDTLARWHVGAERQPDPIPRSCSIGFRYRGRHTTLEYHFRRSEAGCARRRETSICTPSPKSGPEVVGGSWGAAAAPHGGEAAIANCGRRGWR
jgi:hypothetical protein